MSSQHSTRRLLRQILLFFAVAASPLGVTAADSITVPLQNQTGLSDSDYTIYVLGFSTSSKKMLTQTTGTTHATFQAMPSNSGNIAAYKLGTDITQIDIDTSAPLAKIDGARIYFFVADNATFPSPPVIPYSNGGANVTNVKNPPNPAVPPYTFTEFTVVDLDYGAVIDVQTVDGFTFPVTVTLNSNLGQIGQPLTSAKVNRKAILAAYSPFIKSLGAGAAPFSKLQYSGNSGGLLNPGAYLNDRTSTNEFVNLESTLNSYFDSALNTLFSNSKLSLQGVANGGTAADIYTVASTAQQTLPSGLKQQALQFKGASNGLTLNVFNPVGICVMRYSSGGKPTPISGQLDDTTLTFDAPLPANTPIAKGMYVQGAGTNPGATTVVAISRNATKEITGVEINSGSGKPAHSQYGFSKIANMFATSGNMTFGNFGAFAYTGDLTGDSVGILLNLENQIVSALNRGVANKAPSSGSPGYTSKYWATETNWYPTGAPENLFSLFMHTGTIDGTSIFTRPSNAVESARGTLMGQAYGFAYDENPGPVPPAASGQPDVPSKFDPVPTGTNTMTITLGPWQASR